MVRWEKVSRTAFFSGWTPGWVLGAVVYLGLVFVGAPAAERLSGKEFTLCPMERVLRIPCPLCDGTASTKALVTGRLTSAFRFNPLVAVGVPLLFGWIVAWVVFQRRLTVTLPAPLMIALIAAGTAANWIYLISKR